MTQIPEIIRKLSKNYRVRIEKSKQIAEKMIKTAQAAREAAQKTKSDKA